MFKTFPEFSKLTLNDRAEYESHIKDFPPIGDTVFAGLMTWWNPFGDISVSLLNDNLVVPYWIPGDDKNSGLSLLGTNKVDESFCILFDYLKDKGETPRLVNVPEFVISSVRYPEMFTFKGQRSRDEYVLDSSKFYPIKNMAGHRRRKVERIVQDVGEENIVVKSLDLQSAQNRDLLLNAAREWQGRNINNYGKMDEEAVTTSVMNSDALNTENACLFVNGQLHGFCLYVRPPDKRYVIIHYIKATNKNTLGFELMAYAFTKWFVDKGVLYGNVSSDYGLMRLRMFMLTLGPVNFFRKYIVEPA
jgi:hypothetical protein